MSQIETACPGCGRKLRVADDHAGKPARCPMCGTIYTVPDLTSPESDKPYDRWYLRTPEGQTYGPVSRDVLNRWVTEGRVSDDCELKCDAEGNWRNAAETFPVLRPTPQPFVIPPMFDNPIAGEAPAGESSDAAPVRIINPHRGGLILTMGILSWAIGCPLFGVVAWVLGDSDLKQMRRGAMDNRGMGLTQAGQIIGMLHTLLALGALVVGLIVLLVFGLLR